MGNKIRVFDHSEPEQKALMYSLSEYGKFANTALEITRWNQYLEEINIPYESGYLTEINYELIPWQIKTGNIRKEK